MPKRKKLVIISRAGWVERDGQRFLQDNDGYYIDQLASIFDEVTLWTREMGKGAGTLAYGYQLKSKNVRWLNIMRPLGQGSSYELLATTLRGFWDLKDADSTLAFVCTLRGGAYAWIAAKILGVPLITYMGTDLLKALENNNSGRARSALLLGLERISMRAAKVRLVSGPYLLRKFNDFGPTRMVVPVTRLLQLPNLDKREVLTDGSLKLISPVHLRFAKNVDVLIAACALLRDRGIDFTFDIIGDGEARESLEQQRDSLGLQSQIVFHGYISDPKWLREKLLQSDVLIFASRFEGFPRTIWEAVYFGVYVITAKVGGVEHIFDEQHMTQVPEVTPEAFANAVIEAYRSPEQTNRRIDLANRKFNELFEHTLLEQFSDCLELCEQ